MGRSLLRISGGEKQRPRETQRGKVEIYGTLCATFLMLNNFNFYAALYSVSLISGENS